MLTNDGLKAIKDRLARLAVHSSVMALEASKDIAALIAAYEEKAAEVERLRAIIAANPVRSKSVQKRLTAQVLDATPQRKGYDLAGPENHHSARPEKTF